ncbi:MULTISPECIES: LysM peptidoglycan-binding domain-containing protein [Kitasatospora]|uniref:LysM peptidoglycan-binding domain-containing protein n=1 Tax=Kitasatospora TaxID=2063 RepID=UPI000C710215|nr:LysM peptidoglycan-binding domain-containing protein [Kitasatospora sp. GP30]MDH6140166.1 LysM repeat protein [Kitasatospora sp. GP30]
MLSTNGRPSLPSRSALKRAVAVAVVAGVGAGLPLIAAGGANAATPQQYGHHAVQSHHEGAAPVAAQPAAAQAPAQAAPASYTVVSGDTLFKIANAHNVQGGWQKLYDLNKSVLSNPNVIYPGQHLALGAAQQQAAAPAPAQQQSAPVQHKSAPAASTSAAVQTTTQAAAPAPVASTPGSLQALAASIVPADQLASFDQIISHESGWNVSATNPSSGAYGLPQALPGNKMASAGADWQTNPATQLRWALQYMNQTYGSPNAAWAFWQTHSAY